MDVVFIKIKESDLLRIGDNDTLQKFTNTTIGPSVLNFTR